MNSIIDKNKPRPVEVRLRDVSDRHASLRSAEAIQRSVCDFVMLVQGYLDTPEGGDGTEVVSLVAASLDGRSGKSLDVDALYNVWLSLAGQIVNHEDDSVEAMKIRRFVSMVLQRVQLDENLKRLEALKAANPDKTERELVASLAEPGERDSVLG